MKIEESLQHFHSFNKQEKYYFCEFYLHLYIYIYFCEFQRIITATAWCYFQMKMMELIFFKVVYHYQIICNDAWQLDFAKRKHVEIFYTDCSCPNTVISLTWSQKLYTSRLEL